MICKNISGGDELINSNDIREAVHESLQDGRLKDGALKAGDDAVRSWLKTKDTGNHRDYDTDSNSSISSNDSSASNTSSSSENKYSDDDEEMEKTPS